MLKTHLMFFNINVIACVNKLLALLTTSICQDLQSGNKVRFLPEMPTAVLAEDKRGGKNVSLLSCQWFNMQLKGGRTKHHSSTQGCK